MHCLFFTVAVSAKPNIFDNLKRGLNDIL
ncbi:hypothetical protein NPIL_629281, partial [Nephila pilipes]